MPWLATKLEPHMTRQRHGWQEAAPPAAGWALARPAVHCWQLDLPVSEYWPPGHLLQAVDLDAYE